MFTVISCMIVGIVIGYFFRQKKILFIHRLIITLIWVLLFLLGLEIGVNERIISQFAKLGFEAFLLAIAATFGSVLSAWLLWLTVRKNPSEK